MTLDDADAFKAAVDSFQRGSIVVAMAPDASLPAPVCETAMALAERFASEIDKRAVSISAVFPAGLDEIFGASGLKTVLEGKGVEVVARFPVERIASHGIYSVTGNKIPFDLLMMIPPLRRQAAGLIVGQRGLSDPAAIVTDEFMQAAKFPFIYAAGEIASFPGLRSWYMSARQGRVAARNILARLAGTEAFVRYDHKAEWIAAAGLDRPASLGWPGTEGYLAPAEAECFEAAGRIRDEQVAASPMVGPPRPMPRASLI
jgi:hypothetical protein